MARINSAIPGDPRPILDWIYEFYSEAAPCDNDQIREDFDRLYRAINDMELTDVESIVTPVCVLCQDHEQRAFVDGIRVGVQLALDLHLSGAAQ